jgi:hypothetical protein
MIPSSQKAKWQDVPKVEYSFNLNDISWFIYDVFNDTASGVCYMMTGRMISEE